MRNEVIVILLLILISAAVLLYTRRTREGFAETVANKIQDRANPLAAPVNPRMNPSADYGIPEHTDSPNDVDATYLRELNLAALNIPLEQRNADSDISLSPNTVRLSPRLDNENSFLGVVKMCKEKMENLKPGENPFLDADFNKYCGVCMSDGNYITGETFSAFQSKKGVGVVVYEEDKKRALSKQDRYKYKYPRAIPSLDAAQCTGQSMNNDEDAPILAINSAMYDDMYRRKMCQENKQYDVNHTCGKCQVETSQPVWSYVKNARSNPTGPNNPIFLDLWGLGKVKVTVNVDGRETELKSEAGTPMGDVPLNLREKVRFNLMRLMGGVKPIENDIVNVTLKSVNGGVPYFGGFMRGNAPPQDTETKIELRKVLERSTTVGQTEEELVGEGEKLATFTPVPETLQEIKVSFTIPFTLIASEWDATKAQIGFYDCRNNAYITSTRSEKAFKFTDQCAADEEEGSLSNYCITSILAEQKCSSAGDWWKDPRNLAVRAGKETRAAVTAYINGIKSDPKRLMEYEKGCLGRDTSSKCDPYLNDPTRKDVSPECLSEVYNNQLVENPRLSGGAGVIYKEPFTNGGFLSGLRSMVGSFFGVHEHYADYELNYQSLDKNTPQFCRPEGKLNPATDKENRLKNIADAGGIDAVKKYLQDTYIRAVNSSLDINVPDDKGGRKTSWENCFGIDIATPRTVNVRNAPKAPAELLLAGGGNFNCTTTRPLGNPVYVAGATARVGSGKTWNADWTPNAPPMTDDVKCYWIGADPNYMTRVPGGKTNTFKFNFCNPYGFQIDEAYLVGAIDNVGSIKLNGEEKWKGEVAIRTPIKVTIRGMNSSTREVQQNTLEVTCTNHSGSPNPSGIWLAIYATIGGEKKYIVVTNENWVYT